MHWDQRFGPFHPVLVDIAWFLFFDYYKKCCNEDLFLNTVPLDRSTGIELYSENIQLPNVDTYF